jgi:hypothetical protein
VIAHIGALPLEEVLPVLTGAGSGLLAVRAWIMPRLRRPGVGAVNDTTHHAADGAHALGDGRTRATECGDVRQCTRA